MFNRFTRKNIPGVQEDPSLPPGGGSPPDETESESGFDEEFDVRGGPQAVQDDGGGTDFFGEDQAPGPDGDSSFGGEMEEDLTGDVGDGPGEIRPRYPEPDTDGCMIEDDPETGPDPPDDASLDDDDPDDMLAAMSGSSSRKAKKAGKVKAPKKPKSEKDDRHGPPGKIAQALPVDFQNEAIRQTAFTCGCVTAGFCAILLVIFGTVFVCRTLGAKPAPVLANPVGNENVYYDAGGRMHINVYMEREPDTEITVYVLPDGTVTTDKPESQENVKIMTMYVDQDGNVSPDLPEKKPVEPEQSEMPEPAVPASQVLYLDKSGQLVTVQPVDGPWRPITIITTPDGQTSVIPGELQGVKPEEPAEPETQPAVIPQLVLYILSDGTVTTEDPGGDARKFTVDLNDGDLKITQDEPAEPEKPEPDTGVNPYEGKNETEILAEANRRRNSGGSWYLDTDQVYTIIWGDTLGELSKKFDFSVEFLAAYNNIPDKNLIIAGNKLWYPGA